METDKSGFYIGHCSDPGRQRALNEDSYLVLTAPAIAPEIDALFVVADGMGGHQAGNVASRTLVETLDQLFTSPAYQDRVAYNPQHVDYYVVVLKEILEQINEQIYGLSVSHPELRGMGTTATAILFARGRLFWGHVGDSRAYLLSSDGLRRLTRDHTWVEEQVEANLMTPEEAARHPRRNVLTRSLGNSLLLRVERGAHSVRVGDTVLLCSDGLSGLVTDAEIQETLVAESDLQRACDRLVALANQRGGPDNITAVAARLTGDGSGSNIPSGRVLGPVEQKAAPQSLLDTLKIRHKRRSRLTAQEVLGCLVRVLALLLGGLLCGAGAFLISYSPFLPKTKVLLFTFAAVLSFCIGALFGGWILRPFRSK